MYPNTITDSSNWNSGDGIIWTVQNLCRIFHYWNLYGGKRLTRSFVAPVVTFLASLKLYDLQYVVHTWGLQLVLIYISSDIEQLRARVKWIVPSKIYKDTHRLPPTHFMRCHNSVFHYWNKFIYLFRHQKKIWRLFINKVSNKYN